MDVFVCHWGHRNVRSTMELRKKHTANLGKRSVDAMSIERKGISKIEMYVFKASKTKLSLFFSTGNTKSKIDNTSAATNNLSKGRSVSFSFIDKAMVLGRSFS